MEVLWGGDSLEALWEEDSSEALWEEDSSEALWEEDLSEAQLVGGRFDPAYNWDPLRPEPRGSSHADCRLPGYRVHDRLGHKGVLPHPDRDQTNPAWNREQLRRPGSEHSDHLYRDR